MRKRNDSFLSALQAKRDATKQGEATPTTPVPAPTAENPAPDPAQGFTDPEVRAQALSDELRDARLEITREQERRRNAERRAAALESERASVSGRGALSNVFRKNKRPAWK